MPILTTLGAACAKAWGFTSGLAKDQYFNLVSLLLPGNGTNGAQNNTFLDSSTNNFTITRNGNTTQGTFSPFSQTGWGNYFDGTGDYLTVAASANQDFGSSAFTVEFWWYPTANSRQWFYHASTDYWFGIDYNTSGSVMGLWASSNGSSWNLINADPGGNGISTGTPTMSAWNHVAVGRSSGTWSMWLNGTRVLNLTGITSAIISRSAQAKIIGGWASGSAYLVNGYMSNFRVVIGTDVYGVNNSTLTVPTAPLTAITNTAILTCQSNRFIDNSTNNFTITRNGDTRVVAFSPFAPTAAYTTAAVGGSGYFDGTGDYLTAPSNIVDFAAGQAFTVECWVYVSSNTPGQAISANGANAFSLVISGGQVLYGKSGVIDVLVGTMAAANQWVHIAVGRNSSNTSRLWINGTSVATSGSDTYSFNAATMYIGSNSTPANYLNGYMAGLRVVKGSDVYGVANTSITVPTAPFTAITNTRLLLNFTNAGITDATAKNDLETVGNAQISTSVSKFGGGSIAFNGTSDWLVTDNSDNILGFGTGDWTIEFWLRLNSTGTQVIFDGRRSSATNVAPLIYYSGGLKYYTAGSDRITGSALSTGVWYYIALVKSSGSTRMYIDGSQTGSTYTDGNNYIQQSQRPIIGAEGVSVGSNPLNGYIDDLRITKGYARTVTTVPSAPFPVQ